MRKYLFTASFILLSILAGYSMLLAAIPTARINSYADGQSVCSYSASTTSTSLALTVTTTGTPTSVEYSYRLKSESTWIVMGSTGPALPMTWDVSSLTNGGIYEVRSVASNADGTDPNPGLIWLKVNQNPQIGAIAFSAGSTNNVNGKTYVGAKVLDIYAFFQNVLGQTRNMDTTVTPRITLTPKGKSEISGSENTWFATVVSSDTIRQTFAISDTTGDGEAVITVSGGKDVNGFSQDAFSTQITIDTQKPTVSSIQVDEDGDGSFIDNIGYIANGQIPRFYVTFSESVFDITYASYTPAGKTSVALVGPTWIDANQTMCYFTAPAAISNATGDGLAGMVIGGFRDNAFNSADYTATNLVTIDGTLPNTPIITAPANNTTVDEGSVVELTLQNPTDTDIKYASFTDGTNVYRDYSSPYQCPLPMSAGVTFLLATYTDNAGNTSTSAVLNIAVNPLTDKTVPHALIRTVTTITWPTHVDLRAYVNDTETNIEKVEFQYSANNSTWTTIATDAKNDDAFIIPWDISALATGTHYVRAVATDISGNTDATPSAVTLWISQEGGSVTIIESDAKLDPVYSIQGSIDSTANTITAHINSSTQPSVNILLTDIYSGDTNYLLPSQITVTGSGTSWDATVTNTAITNNVYGCINVIAQNTTGETIYRNCNVGAIPIDITKASILNSNAQFGFGYTINANSFKENTNVLVKTIATPVTTQPNIIAVGPTYDLSLANGITTFAPITLSFTYPNLNNTGGLYPNSTALQTKLTVCYWNEESQKWVRDRNLVHAAAGLTSINCTTNHFSKFSVIADYAKPTATDISINGGILSAKVIDDGSGIYAVSFAGSYLKVNGTTYYATNYDQDSDLVVFEAGNLTDAGDYPYVLRIIDRVGNYTEYTGILSYTKKNELTDAHNYPNPFNPDIEDTTIRFILSEDSYITVRIYDFNGDLVTILQRNDWQSQGLTEYKWGGTNDNGRKVANGTYFAEILASGSAGVNSGGRTVRKIIKIAVIHGQEG